TGLKRDRAACAALEGCRSHRAHGRRRAKRARSRFGRRDGGRVRERDITGGRFRLWPPYERAREDVTTTLTLPETVPELPLASQRPRGPERCSQGVSLTRL